MALPFVSRDRYDELQGRYNQLLEDRETLLDRIMLLSGNLPLYTLQEQPRPASQLPATPLPATTAADSMPIRQRATFDSVRAAAQIAVNTQPAETYRETK
jgi:hypothetical protein